MYTYTLDCVGVQQANLDTGWVYTKWRVCVPRDWIAVQVRACVCVCVCAGDGVMFNKNKRLRLHR